MRPIAGVSIAVALLLVQVLSAQRPAERWTGTWAAAEVGRPETPPPPQPPAPGQPPPSAPAPFVQFQNQTLRQIVRTSIGGSRVRMVLSNRFGTAPLAVGAAHIALRGTGASVVAGSDRALAFSGETAVTIPPGALVLSDPVDLEVPPLADLAVDLFLPGQTDTPSPLTMHVGALQTSYVSGPGNYAGATAFPQAATVPSWFLVARVEVLTSAGTVVAFGDSITDGARSTRDTNHRYPDQLARRLNEAGRRFAVLNAGIGGNRLLSDAAYSSGQNALARFERDVLAQPGVTHVIVLEGINDIGNALRDPVPSAADLIAAHRQMIDRAHERGIKMLGATLTPFKGASRYTPEGEAKRSALNEWIRAGGAYDGVVDFDAATRDPADPLRFNPEFDSGDHLHPNDAGYTAMGNAVNLDYFK